MTRNLLAIRTLSRAEIEDLVEMAALYKQCDLAGDELPGIEPRSIGLLFFEDSTRTRVSFEQAANRLGCRTVNFSGSGSSMSKGETLKDTILTLRHEQLEAVVMRHRSSGSAALAAQHIDIPVINAGDGEHEHPTQALGDALTIIERKGGIDGLKVTIVGDVKHSRVARSNAWLLSKMGAEVRFVGPRPLLPAHTANLPGDVYFDLESGLEGADVVMCLRLQRERMQSGLLASIGQYRRMYQINANALKAAARNVIVMHPGPLNRGIEVDDATADSERSAITDQLTNGVYARMAAMRWAFTEEGE